MSLIDKLEKINIDENKCEHGKTCLDFLTEVDIGNIKSMHDTYIALRKSNEGILESVLAFKESSDYFESKAIADGGMAVDICKLSDLIKKSSFKVNKKFTSDIYLYIKENYGIELYDDGRLSYHYSNEIDKLIPKETISCPFKYIDCFDCDGLTVTPEQKMLNNFWKNFLKSNHHGYNPKIDSFRLKDNVVVFKNCLSIENSSFLEEYLYKICDLNYYNNSSRFLYQILNNYEHGSFSIKKPFPNEFPIAKNEFMKKITHFRPYKNGRFDFYFATDTMANEFYDKYIDKNYGS